jgi:hypothetical protein
VACEILQAHGAAEPRRVRQLQILLVTSLLEQIPGARLMALVIIAIRAISMF